MAGGGSLVTSARKAVDFCHIIIHVINVALVITAMWFNKMLYNISTIPGSSASYLQFCSSSSRHLQVVLSSVTHFYICKLRAAKYGEQISPTNQLQQLWSRTVRTCASSAHPKTVILSTQQKLSTQKWTGKRKLHLEGWWKCHVYTWFRSAIWLVPPEQGGRSRQLFL